MPGNGETQNIQGWGSSLRMAVAHGVSSFPKSFEFDSLCSLYVCRLCINYQDLSTNLPGGAALRMLLLTFISHFVIDFLSIRKVIIFSVIATYAWP